LNKPLQQLSAGKLKHFFLQAMPVKTDLLRLTLLLSVLIPSRLRCLFTNEKMNLKKDSMLIFFMYIFRRAVFRDARMERAKMNQKYQKKSIKRSFRCGMIYMDPEELGSTTLVTSWLQTSLPDSLTKQQKDNVRMLFNWLVIFRLPSCSVDVHGGT